MELQLSLSLHNQPPIHDFKPKPNFQDSCHLTNDDQLPQTLPLLSWNDQHHPPNAPFSTFHTDDEDDDDHPIGWPPIESRRRKVVQRRPVGPKLHNFVKVKMEGIAIARKLDLGVYHSHQSLKIALISMFSTYPAIHDNGWDFTLIYEDQDGDWLLAEDLPWNSFVESVQRLKILVRKGNKE